jgi:hypothetical protein
MYIYNIIIKEDKYELISKEKFNKEILVNKYLLERDMPEFYEDTQKFIEEHCKISVREGIKKLYLIHTNKSGWDTYDSAVYCAYSERQAIELSEEKMSSHCLKYTNLAKEMGTAENFIEIGEVVSSFNAG